MKAVTFRELLELVDEHERTVGRASYKHFFRLISNQLDLYFGKLTVEEVTPMRIAKYKIMKLSSGCKGSTVNRHLAVLKKIFNFGLKMRLIDCQQPVVSEHFEKESPGREVFLTPDQQDQLMAACPPYVRTPIRVALRLGMRKGNLLDLKDTDCDLPAGRLRILDNKTKTWRWVAIPETEKPLIQSLVTRARAERELGINADGYLFLSRLRGRYSEGGFRREFAKALKACGLDDFRWHDLRHCCASDLVNSGASLPVIGQVLGHKDVRTTNKYAHLNLDAMRKAMKDRQKFLVEKSA